MRLFLYLVTTLVLTGLAFWAYNEINRTQQAIDKTEKIQREIGAARERLSVLRAEWAYLNRPDRLRDLAELNFTRLGLLPLRSDQFGRVDQVTFPIPETDPTLPITSPVDVSSQNANGGAGQ